MQSLIIEGGRPLYGEVDVHGSKNSVLPILASTLLAADTCAITNCPHLRDVEASVTILRHLGCRAEWEGGTLVVDTAGMNRCDIPDELMREMRSSVIFLGAILARRHEAQLSYPGGCELGPRPIDIHLAALRTLGAQIDECGGELHCCAAKLRAAEIILPMPSVGATENAILAAVGACGTTTIYNAAREPEIVDLQAFLTAMGAGVCGAGTSLITVQGGRKLHGCTHCVMADRIVAATYLAAAAAAGGEIRLRNVDYRPLSTMALALTESGCRVVSERSDVTLQSSGELHSVRPVRTAPYPGFPTDAQPVLMAALLKSDGCTVFVENIFENRYRHTDELARMGAQIRVAGRVAVVSGVPELHGAAVRCTDLRGGAALVIAGLTARGCTRVSEIRHIDRGYASIENDLSALGASIRRENT